jgi:hypothetical protein
MRALFLVVFACSILVTKAFSEDVDYTRFAPTERARLAKCLFDMLTVIKRHSLRKHLPYFLEAGCALEMHRYKVALRSHWPHEWQQSEMETEIEKILAGSRAESTNKVPQYVQSIIDGGLCQMNCMKIATSGITILIAGMEEAAVRIYTERPVSFCSDDACPLDAYRRCLLLQISEQVSRRTELREFDKVAQQTCRTAESAARAGLTIDFMNAQKLQLDSELTGKTRDLINDVITDIRHENVITYAEDLTKVQPGRKSCREKLCGDVPCIRVGPEREPEYKCAIGELKE